MPRGSGKSGGRHSGLNMWSIVLLGVSMSACLSRDTDSCPNSDLVCPPNTRCSPGGATCIDDALVAACDGVGEGGPCVLTGSPGRCEGGLCSPFECPPNVVLPPVARPLEIAGCEACSSPTLRGLNVIAYVQEGVIYRSDRRGVDEAFSLGEAIRPDCCPGTCEAPHFVTGEDIAFSRPDADPMTHDILLLEGDLAEGYNCTQVDDYVGPEASPPGYTYSHPATFDGDYALVFSGRPGDSYDLIYAERNRLNTNFDIIDDGRLDLVNDPDSDELGASVSALSLYFASDRFDGNFDIFVSERIGTAFSAPVRLGSPTVNTSANETDPFVDDVGNLYFTRTEGDDVAIWWIPRCGLP